VIDPPTLRSAIGLACTVTVALLLIGGSMIYTLRQSRTEVGTKMRVAVFLTAAFICALVGLVALIYAHNLRRQLLHNDLLLSQNQWITIADPGLVVREMISEACIPFSAEYKLLFQMRSRKWQLIRRSDGAVLTISARFLTQRGNTFATSQSFGLSRRDDGPDICFERRNDPKGNRYAALQVLASDTATITAVNWWSGAQLGSP